MLQQKFPRRLVPDRMHEYGDITIVCHPFTKVIGSYTVSADDGRLCVTGWKKFMEEEHFMQMGDKMLFLLFVANAGAFLFVSYIPEVAVQ